MRIAMAAAVVAAGLAAPAAAFAGEIHVPDDMPRLGDALDAAQPGDVVVLDRGVQRGTFVMHTAGVTLEGRGGRIVTGRRAAGQGASALWITGADVTVRNVEFQGAGVEVHADGVLVEGCRFRGVGGRAGAPNLMQAEVRLAIAAWGDGHRIAGNVIDARRRSVGGIHVDGAGAVIEDNDVLGVRGGNGIQAFGDGVRIAGNRVVADRGRNGILVRGDDAVIEGNEIRMERAFGVGMLVDGASPEVVENAVDTVDSGGASIVVGASDGLVAGNDVVGGAGTGVVVWGDGNAVALNGVRGMLAPSWTASFGHGIVARGSGNMVWDNGVADAAADGIRVDGYAGNEVDGCDVTGCGGCGMVNLTEDTSVTDSTFLGNGTDLVNGGTLSVFERNEFATGCPDPTNFDGGDLWDDFGSGTVVLVTGD
jgi:hypothetical protein